MESASRGDVARGKFFSCSFYCLVFVLLWLNEFTGLVFFSLYFVATKFCKYTESHECFCLFELGRLCIFSIIV